VPGGGYAVVNSFGSVSMVGASGATEWQLDTQQIYQDWGLTWQAVYSLPASVLAPVTTGPGNGFCPDGCAPAQGYDEITGLGSPRASIDAALAAATG
jgi:hypothetical protein